MDTRRILDLGVGTTKATILAGKPITFNADVWGLRIGEQSELDQCLLVKSLSSFRMPGTEQSPGVTGALAPGSTVNGQGLARDVIKLSVSRPYSGFLERGNYTVFPSRAIKGNQAANEARALILDIDVCERKEEIMWHPTARSPFDADYLFLPTYTASFASEFSVANFPVFGRRWMSFEFKSDGSGSSNQTIKVEAIRGAYDIVSEAVVELATTVVATQTVTNGNVFAYEGDTECDFLRVTFGATAAGQQVINAHLRAED